MEFPGKKLFVSANSAGVPVLCDVEHKQIRAFKLPRNCWRVYQGGQINDATPSEMAEILEVYKREGKTCP
jgi:hypothetical protein